MKTMAFLVVFGILGAMWANGEERKKDEECARKGGTLKRFFRDAPLCLKNNSIIE